MITAAGSMARLGVVGLTYRRSCSGSGSACDRARIRVLGMVMRRRTGFSCAAGAGAWGGGEVTRLDTGGEGDEGVGDCGGTSEGAVDD